MPADTCPYCGSGESAAEDGNCTQCGAPRLVSAKGKQVLPRSPRGGGRKGAYPYTRPDYYAQEVERLKREEAARKARSIKNSIITFVGVLLLCYLTAGFFTFTDPPKAGYFFGAATLGGGFLGLILALVLPLAAE